MQVTVFGNKNKMQDLQNDTYLKDILKMVYAKINMDFTIQIKGSQYIL